MRFLQKQKGQGLIETTVAIGIVVTAIVGTITLVNYTLRSTTSTANRLIANQLALEGVEIVVNLRDSNYDAGQPFDTGLVSGSDTTAIVVFDPLSNEWLLDFAPNSIDEESARIYREGGLYRQDTIQPTGTPTIYSRIVEIDGSVADQLTVTSHVQWAENENTLSTQVSRTLYDWR